MTAEAATVSTRPRERAARWTRSDLLAAGGVFSVALVLRLLHLREIHANDPFFLLPSVDPRLYHEWALNIHAGDWLGDEVFFLGPLYPFFLALVYGVFGTSILAAKLVQNLLGAVSCVLVFALAREVFDRRVALLAGLMTALYSMLIFYEGTLMIVNLQVPLVLLVVLASVHSLREPRFASWLATGALLGLSALARQTTLLYAVPLLLWLFAALRDLPLRRRAALAGATVLGLALFLAPAAIRNYAVSGDIVLLNASGGYNLYMGNNRHADGTWRPPSLGSHTRVDDPLEMRAAFTRYAEEREGRELAPSEVSAWWRGRALEFVREHPVHWLRLELRKLVFFANASEVWNNRTIELSREFSWVLRLPLLSFGVVAPLGLLGIALTAPHWRRLVPLYAMLGAYLAFALVFFVLSRWRMPAVPILIVFAAAAGVSLWDAARSRRFTKLGVSALLLAVFAFVVHLRVPAPNLAMAYYNLGNKYKQLERWDEAIESYVKSVRIRASNPSAWNNLALTYEASGRHDFEAKETWEALLRWGEASGNEAYVERARRHLAILEARAKARDE